MKVRAIYVAVFLLIAVIVYFSRFLLDLISPSYFRALQFVEFFALAGVADYILKKILSPKK